MWSAATRYITNIVGLAVSKLSQFRVMVQKTN
jgi:hypothetical protein